MASLRGGTSMTINTTWQSCRETKYFLECNFPNAQCVDFILFCFRIVRLIREIIPPPISWLPCDHEYQTGFLMCMCLPHQVWPLRSKSCISCVYRGSVQCMCFHFSSCRCIANSTERASHLSTSIPASPQLEEVRSG